MNAYHEQKVARNALRGAREFLKQSEIEHRNMVRNHDYMIANRWMTEAHYASNLMHLGKEITAKVAKVVEAEMRLAAANANLKEVNKSQEAG